MGTPTLTLGIDLASQPANTAICAIKWGEEAPEVIQLARGRNSLADTESTELHNRALKRAILGDVPGNEAGLRVTKVGIDAPFGWPTDFVDRVNSWHARDEWDVELGYLESPENVRQMAFRVTDRHVWSRPEVVKRPLSVSTDKLAYPAMRCVTLLADLMRLEGIALPKDGAGLVCEVYPDAALRVWNVDARVPGLGPRTGYKGKGRERIRGDIVNAIRAATGLVGEGSFFDACRHSDDCLDALVSALVARAVALKLTERPSDADLHSEDLEMVMREGWIHLPAASESLGLLRGEPGSQS